MSLTLFDFEPFCEEETNADIVAQNKFGIYELIDGSFIKKEITESEFVNYQFAIIDYLEVIQELGDGTSAGGRPFVQAKI